MTALYIACYNSYTEIVTKLLCRERGRGRIRRVFEAHVIPHAVRVGGVALTARV